MLILHTMQLLGITTLLTPRKPHPPKISAGDISSGQGETHLQPMVGGSIPSAMPGGITLLPCCVTDPVSQE